MYDKVLNKDFKNGVEGLVFRQGRTKDGSDYYYFDLLFKNKYSKRIFLNNESMFAIFNLADLLENEGIIGE